MRHPVSLGKWWAVLLTSTTLFYSYASQHAPFCSRIVLPPGNLQSSSEGPSTQYWRFPGPNTMPCKHFSARSLEYWVSERGRSGSVQMFHSSVGRVMLFYLPAFACRFNNDHRRQSACRFGDPSLRAVLKGQGFEMFCRQFPRVPSTQLYGT